MDCFDDLQIEDFSMFDFVEEANEPFLDDENEVEEEKFSLNDYLNSNIDY